MMQQDATLDKPVVSGPNAAVLRQMLQLIYGRFAGQAVCLAAKLGIADYIAAGSDTTDKLASVLNADRSSLSRFLRALASNGVLAETHDHWKLTAAGELLRGHVAGSVRDLARLFATREHAQSWLALEHSVLSGRSAFEHVHGTGGWNYAQEHPAFNQVFNAAMTSLAGSVHRTIADAYDFTGMELLIDVGGGHGRLMAHILHRFQRLHGIVYDMPHVVAGAAAYFAEEGLSDRCRAVAGDFFQSVPEGADAYIMTAILHDWDDDASEAILKNCRVAMKPGGRVLIGDFVLKPANEPDFGKTIDLEMLIMTPSGRERSEGDFRRLLDRSDLRLNRIIPLPSATSLVEAVAK
jgi:SAM-dependent methyltransferase